MSDALRDVRITNPQRVLFPSGFTKGDLIAYYRAVAPAILPHLRDRPVMLWRFPEGVDAYGWFQTRCKAMPRWLRTFTVPFGSQEPYCILDDEESLVAAANISAVELHPLLWRVPEPVPTVVAFDLDVGRPAGIREAARASLLLRSNTARVKTSRSGLHVFEDVRGKGFDETKAAVRARARALAAEHPDLFVDAPRRAARAGRVYVDWTQNSVSRSLVAPYSLRAGPSPRVSAPVTWDEVERCARGELDLMFEPADVLARLDSLGDLWA